MGQRPTTRGNHHTGGICLRVAGQTEGNALLYDFWLKILHGEALLIVEQAVDNGLEGFRLLHQKYDPQGAQHDLERYHQLTYGVKPAKTLIDLPRVIVAWESELKEFQRKARDFSAPAGWQNGFGCELCQLWL